MNSFLYVGIVRLTYRSLPALHCRSFFTNNKKLNQFHQDPSANKLAMRWFNSIIRNFSAIGHLPLVCYLIIIPYL